MFSQRDRRLKHRPKPGSGPARQRHAGADKFAASTANETIEPLASHWHKIPGSED
jgi:hypothetical protein